MYMHSHMHARIYYNYFKPQRISIIYNIQCCLNIQELTVESVWKDYKKTLGVQFISFLCLLSVLVL